MKTNVLFYYIHQRKY